jgi:hypothetical protein
LYRKDTILLEDNLSQSQSSTSSTSSTIQGQKNVQGFKEKIKEEQSPFFVRYFFRLGILLFLIVLAACSKFRVKSLVLEYVLLYQFIKFLDVSYDNMDLIYKQYNSLITIPFAFRTIYQMYLKEELDESNVFNDRITAYLEIVLLL